MSLFGQNYQVDDNYFIEVQPGEYTVKITSVRERTAQKSNNPMIEITLSIDTGGFVYYYLVDDRRTVEAAIQSNKRITQFFDCFNIRRGNFNINQWLNAKGRVRVNYGKAAKNGKMYVEVKQLVLRKNNNNLSLQQYAQRGYSQPPIAQAENEYPQMQRQPVNPNIPQRKIQASYIPQENTQSFSSNRNAPTEKELMQEARENGLYVSDEYLDDDNAPTDEAYEEVIY